MPGEHQGPKGLTVTREQPPEAPSPPPSACLTSTVTPSRGALWGRAVQGWQAGGKKPIQLAASGAGLRCMPTADQSFPTGGAQHLRPRANSRSQLPRSWGPIAPSFPACYTFPINSNTPPKKAKKLLSYTLCCFLKMSESEKSGA